MSDMDEVTVRPMKGGDGLYSYSKNSAYQRQAIEAAIELINKAVEEFDAKTLLSCKTIRVADLGCSTGPNTFLAVQLIIDSLERKLHSERGQSEANIVIPEFQVFFNDLVSNDFNQLFLSLPKGRKYFAAGVPGSFHGPLFPKDSLHFVHSSGSVHWLSRVPEEAVDKGSSAWNKGLVYYSNSTDEVARAFGDQYAKDMDKFLKFRAQEIVDGGLMALIIYGRSNGSPHSKAYLNKAFEQVECALIDMAKEGKISKEEIDSFNIPVYLASPEEVESAVKRNGCLSIETMEIVSHEMPQPKSIPSHLRAALKGLIKDHFGEEILDDLFGTVLPKKLEDFSAFFESLELISIFVTLKRVKK